ncbi:MAG: hypothetical protein JKY22_01195 [Flavobacteriaceae bacterium]|nr:hypothetical protein [Flavobacteriaceae bacterium]
MKNYTLLVLISLSFLFGCEEPYPNIEIKASNTSEESKIKKQSVVFITGIDEDEDGNNYYANATAHFENKKMKIVKNIFSLEEIMSWLISNNNRGQYNEIHIVSHSNAWRGMSLRVNKNGPRVTKKTLTDVLEKKILPKLDERVDKKTKIIFHSCGLGKNETLLQLLKTIFSSEQIPQIYASPHFNIFGGRYASHYLANPYYTYYPTAQSKGPKSLAKEIKNTYPNIKMNWLSAIKSRGETKIGEAYSYRFNIPVDWKISFEKEEDIPDLYNREDIMDWIVDNEAISLTLYELEIPIEKFRWTSNLSGKILEIKGKTTIVCVLKPITNCNDTSEYEILSLDNSNLYTCL